MFRLTLEAARKNKKLTQIEAASKLGISNQTLSKYESDPSAITLRMLDKMSKLYGVPKELFFLSEDFELKTNKENKNGNENIQF